MIYILLYRTKLIKCQSSILSVYVYNIHDLDESMRLYFSITKIFCQFADFDL